MTVCIYRYIHTTNLYFVMLHTASEVNQRVVSRHAQTSAKQKKSVTAILQPLGSVSRRPPALTADNNGLS